MEWQPIETAPKDGTPYLAVEMAGGKAIDWAVCSWHVTSKGRKWMNVLGSAGHDCEPTIDPTHWTPLPEPPG